jgi:ABC-2 type transport system ATP-binding protein
MRQRIKMAQCMVHNPQVMVLDEPMNGLDPASRHEVSSLLQRLGAEGKCILVSSHILYEVEQITKNILLMNRGRLLAQGDIYRIRSLIDAHPHRIALSTDRPREMAQRLLDLSCVLSVKLDDAKADRLDIETREPETFYSQFPQIVLENGFVVQSFDSPDNNLEAVFTYLVKG